MNLNIILINLNNYFKKKILKLNNQTLKIKIESRYTKMKLINKKINQNNFMKKLKRLKMKINIIKMIQLKIYKKLSKI